MMSARACLSRATLKVDDLTELYDTYAFKGLHRRIESKSRIRICFTLYTVNTTLPLR